MKMKLKYNIDLVQCFYDFKSFNGVISMYGNIHNNVKHICVCVCVCVLYCESVTIHCVCACVCVRVCVQS